MNQWNTGVKYVIPLYFTLAAAMPLLGMTAYKFIFSAWDLEHPNGTDQDYAFGLAYSVLGFMGLFLWHGFQRLQRK